MAGSSDLSGKSFSELEHSGWERAAPFYHTMVGAITGGVAEPLLDATCVGPGKRVLEVCCGPGYVSAAALARGAEATGIDFSRGMVERARRLVPGARFDEGDAQALPYEEASFDAVCCPFGLLHLPEPERGLAEGLRVLKPGGFYGYTVWCPPEKVEFFELVLGAVKAHGNMDVPLPEAPPMFRFSDPAEGGRVLREAGFVEPRFAEVPLAFRPEKPEDVLELTYKSAVRTPMVLRLQSDEARERIHAAIIEGAGRYVKDGRIELAMPAVMGCARKPAGGVAARGRS